MDITSTRVSVMRAARRIRGLPGLHESLIIRPPHGALLGPHGVTQPLRGSVSRLETRPTQTLSRCYLGACGSVMVLPCRSLQTNSDCSLCWVRSQLQAQKLRLARSQGPYYGGSLPNVNQIGRNHQDHFQGSFPSSLESNRSTRHHGLVERVQRDRGFVSPVRPYRRQVSFSSDPSVQTLQFRRVRPFSSDPSVQTGQTLQFRPFSSDGSDPSVQFLQFSSFSSDPSVQFLQFRPFSSDPSVQFLQFRPFSSDPSVQMGQTLQFRPFSSDPSVQFLQFRPFSSDPSVQMGQTLQFRWVRPFSSDGSDPSVQTGQTLQFRRVRPFSSDPSVQTLQFRPFSSDPSVQTLQFSSFSSDREDLQGVDSSPYNSAYLSPPPDPCW
ncbi:hypothetical protein NQZ68_020165 [Dissostichus eleginoides]|nr:hypothetical protein NQZ68_020165 [Dissostichus eleginoides]